MAGVWPEVQTGRVPGRGLGGGLLPPAAGLDPQTGRGAHAARILVDNGHQDKDKDHDDYIFDIDGKTINEFEVVLWKEFLQKS